MIINFVENTYIKEQLLVVNFVRGSNVSGAPYLSIDFKDCSGNINGKKWAIEPNDEVIFTPGNVVEVEGEVLLYKDIKQIKIKSVKVVPPLKVDMAKFLQTAPIAKENLMDSFIYYVDSISNTDYSKIVKALVKRHEPLIYDYPAAVSIHHEYMSGLLMHTVSMCKIADFLCTLYKGVDRDLLIAGVLIHDIGKTIEFEGSPLFRYSLEGKLLGHITIMTNEIKQVATELNIVSEAPLLLEHMVLSHHGEPEYGSPIRPLIIEAMLLSMIDNLDSKTTYALKNLDGVDNGDFTQKLFALDNRLLYKHK